VTNDVRYRLTPQMRDYDALGVSWLPYLMFFQAPDRLLASVSTDKDGFRHTLNQKGELLPEVAAFATGTPSEECCIFLGGSTAFGVGATGNGKTIPSLLNARTNQRWLNFGGRAYNSTQELLLLMMHLPKKIRRVVVFSGVNNLTLSFVSPKTSPVFGSFFFQSKFERQMAQSVEECRGIKAALRDLFREVRSRFTGWHPPQEKMATASGQRTADLALVFERDMRLLAALRDAHRFEVSYVLQPVVNWLGKKLSPEERELFAFLDAQPDAHWQVLAEHLDKEGPAFRDLVKKNCLQFGFHFQDLNTHPILREEEWLFVDRVHFTDRGYERVADAILENVESK